MNESNHSSPLLTLWYKPRVTLQGLIAAGKGGEVAWVVAVLFGWVMVAPRYLGDEPAGSGLMLAGGLLGLLSLALFSWLLRNFSRWFGAQARLADIRTALGWGLMPWTLLPGLLLFFIATQGADPGQLFPLFFGALIYGFVILLSSVSVALRLSPMQTFFCLILTFVVSIFPLTLVGQLFFGPPAPAP